MCRLPSHVRAAQCSNDLHQLSPHETTFKFSISGFCTKLHTLINISPQNVLEFFYFKIQKKSCICPNSIYVDLQPLINSSPLNVPGVFSSRSLNYSWWKTKMLKKHLMSDDEFLDLPLRANPWLQLDELFVDHVPSSNQVWWKSVE